MAVISIAAVGLLRIGIGGIAVAVALLLVVSAIAAIAFATRELSFRIYAWPVIASGLSLSLALLLIDWAASTDDRAITFLSFMSYVAAAILSPGILFIAGPLLLLFAAASVGMLVGRSIKRRSDVRARVGRARP
ncbi:MAG TPA: hypothetical protein VEK79_25070 [Thermoanaerobaculia bacterium]|nr:hypothetical protein [Thermoanaerobaculia bacterium]